MSTLIYHTGALGDFVTAIPAIRYYKKLNAGKKTTLLGRAAIGVFALDMGLVDGWLDVDGTAVLALFHDDFSDTARTILAKFSSVIIFANADSPLLRNVQKSAITGIYWQPPFPLSPIHIVDYHLSLFCDPEKIEAADKIPSLIPSASSIASAKKIMGDIVNPVALHPGSGSIKKNWGFDNFVAVAKYFRSKKIPVLWIKGPAEESFTFPAQDSLISNPELPVLAAILSRCSAFVGNDSGVTHLAAAAGCLRTIAVFGPESDDAVWKPRGKCVLIIPQEKINKLKSSKILFKKFPGRKQLNSFDC